MHRPLTDWFGAHAWHAGNLRPGAAAAAARLIAHLDDPDGRAEIVLLLGLLAEGRSSAPGLEASTHEAVRSGLDRFVALLNDGDAPLRASLLFVLAHFPEDRRRILDAAIAAARLDADELTRLDRCLQRPTFPDARAARRLGRSWPSPAACDAVARDHGLIHSQSLPPDELSRVWELETETLLAYSGARAHHAIERSAR